MRIDTIWLSVAKADQTVLVEKTYKKISMDIYYLFSLFHLFTHRIATAVFPYWTSLLTRSCSTPDILLGGQIPAPPPAV